MSSLLKNKNSSFKTKVYSGDEVIEGMVIRPLILLFSFVGFIVSIFLLLYRQYLWAGSFIIFSFVFNMYGIYLTLNDKPSMYRNLNFAFKFILFVSEVILFNWLIIYSA